MKGRVEELGECRVVQGHMTRVGGGTCVGSVGGGAYEHGSQRGQPTVLLLQLGDASLKSSLLGCVLRVCT